MRFSEFSISEATKPVIAPSAVQQQQRINKVVANYAASEQQQQQPTGMEVAIAMRRYAEMKKRADRAYAARAKQELAIAQSAVK